MHHRRGRLPAAAQRQLDSTRAMLDSDPVVHAHRNRPVSPDLHRYTPPDPYAQAIAERKARPR